MRAVDSPSRATSRKHDREEDSAVSSDEVGHLTDNHESSEPDEPSPRKAKRARIVKSKSKAPRKKYVKGKQGALQGIMKIPIEVFTEIAYHITPADLITLVRTNKFFRAVLLRRSSILIWQRAQTNVPGLPPCPTGMSEPQYAALIFSKFCTLCGASALVQPDPWLRVRLCASCRETKLREIIKVLDTSQGFNFVAKSYYIKGGKTHRRHGCIVAFCIRAELERVWELREEFQRKGDHKGLREWEREMSKRLDTQKEETGPLRKYLASVAVSRAHELGGLKAERREQVYERLGALGWDEKYLDFTGGESRQWNSLVDAPKPLTERIWTNLLPKLTPLLEQNRSRVDETEKRLRRLGRLEKVQVLMRQFKRNTHPYQAIVDLLSLTIPTITAKFHNTNEVLHVPFPTLDTAVEWDFIKEIYEEENSLDSIEDVFNERRAQLNDKLLNWRQGVEHQLVKQYVTDDGKEQTNKTDPIVTVQGSTEATNHLSPNVRFLLRADTVFIRRPLLEDLSLEDQEYGPVPWAHHFPEMISTFYDHPDSYIFNDTHLASLDDFVRHASVEKIVKALLKEMGTPDVAHIELSSKNNVFACGRCYRVQPMTWEELVAHYYFTARRCVGGKYKGTEYSTRHPAVIRDTHDLEPKSNPRPLIRVLPDNDRKAARDSFLTKEGWVWCLICYGAGLDDLSPCSSLGLMQEHMHTMHAINSNLAEGIHYTKDYYSIRGQSNRLPQWQKDWDAYYDARAGDASEPDSPAGPFSATETAAE